MTVFLRLTDDGGARVQARLEGERGVGDLVREVGPDDDFRGWSGRELAALGDGEHEIEPKASEAPQAPEASDAPA